MSRYYGERELLEGKEILTVDNDLFRKAYFTVLQQSLLVARYIEEHLVVVLSKNIGSCHQIHLN